MPVPARQLGAEDQSRSAAPTPCPVCTKLAREEREAVSRGDQSRATDCRVLIARHPHGGEAA
ncbi:hypothetical protein [Streptomyces sp. SID11385]|uniref:hypothetical protein n=1 Tax=Streptomyces sp. SID11385 TaxID=2706031 RepID=UPI0013C7E001|nr:hypothetical protein [Streptomyces sp. SID11385]NEA40202.1 hypothetical protein [Streptomyces sp. SID11385]